MRTKFTAAALILLLLPSKVTAEVMKGKWSSTNGEVTVEEDLTTSKYPRHIIALLPLDGSSKAGYLVLRCEQNKTEVYFVAAEFEFFGFGRDPKISARFKSEAEAKPLRTAGSSDADAAFIETPIDFVMRFVEEGQVVLAGNYYGGRFTGLYKTDATILDGIYGMAETCGWSSRLPVRDTATAAIGGPTLATDGQIGPQVAPANSAPKTPDPADLKEALKALVERYGLPAVLKALGEV